MTAGESSRPGDHAPEEPREDLPAGIEEREIEDVEEHSRLRVPVIYEVVRREGETEMRRPATSLWWSGVAAGLSISFSLLGQAALNSHLPDVAWRPLVSGFGYSIGFLIAAMVWLIPSAEGAQFHVVCLMTWLIAISGSKHIIAGSVEAFLLLVNGQIGFGQMLVGFTIPVLFGNVIGGTALFALISYAQVMREI